MQRLVEMIKKKNDRLKRNRSPEDSEVIAHADLLELVRMAADSSISVSLSDYQMFLK